MDINVQYYSIDHTRMLHATCSLFYIRLHTESQDGEVVASDVSVQGVMELLSGHTCRAWDVENQIKS